MESHSVVEAKNQLSRLIDRALAGERVVVTRHGTPVVELRPLTNRGRPMTAADLAWIASRRVTMTAAPKTPIHVVAAMREDDDERLLRR
jgi:prevent-host-death family protein